MPKKVGFRILNPLQTTAAGMEGPKVVEAFGSSVCLWAGIDTQHLLPFAPAEAVAREVEDAVRLFSQNRGYLFAPAHNVAAGTPVDNVLAMFAAIEKVNRGL
jgi:uroporphyrinogen-III decarboxylase